MDIYPGLIDPDKDPLGKDLFRRIKHKFETVFTGPYKHLLCTQQKHYRGISGEDCARRSGWIIQFLHGEGKEELNSFVKNFTCTLKKTIDNKTRSYLKEIETDLLNGNYAAVIHQVWTYFYWENEGREKIRTKNIGLLLAYYIFAIIKSHTPETARQMIRDFRSQFSRVLESRKITMDEVNALYLRPLHEKMKARERELKELAEHKESAQE